MNPADAKAMTSILTSRLELRPITLDLVIAILDGARRSDIEKTIGAEIPWAWPARALIEQVFRASLEDVKADPGTRLWGDRLMITKDEPRRVVGSVVFHGRPGPDGACELGYGVDDTCQNKGYATEALTASLAWAFAQPECKVVRATTMPWHKGSKRVLEKVGMVLAGKRPAEDGEEMLVYELRANA